MHRNRRPFQESSSKANFVGHFAAAVVTALLTPVTRWFTHGQQIPFLILSFLVYLAIFFYIRMKVFDLIDGE